MIDWLTGSTRSDHQSLEQCGMKKRPEDCHFVLSPVLDEAATVHEEAPETPAPLFAVRAFKQAIFGTPQSTTRQLKPRENGAEVPTKDVTKARPSLSPTATEPADTALAVIGAGQPTEDRSPTEQRRCVDHLESPTKGILLTPGTGAKGRKTVSFDKETKAKDVLMLEIIEDDADKDVRPSPMTERGHNAVRSLPHKRQSALTRTLIEMSSKRNAQPDPSIPVVSKEIGIALDLGSSDAAVAFNGNPGETTHDQTIDLSQPRSRSGRHWKTEFEQYHTRSNHEIRKILQYGQNVKSYAVKKDYEATSLNERLTKETAKAARLEAKVTKLAQQLAMMQQSQPETESNQTRLVGELAQQTALVARYQRKAEYYRRALRKASPANPAAAPDTDSQSSQEDAVSEETQSQALPEVVQLQKQTRSLEEVASQAKSKAEKLEVENQQLKRSLSRIKQEMMNYETRRHAREDRLLKREDRHKKAKEQIEMKYVKLEKDHQMLLDHQRTEEQSRTRRTPRSQSTGFAGNSVKSHPVQIHNGIGNGQDRCSSMSPSKRRSLRRSTVDIWAPSSPREDVNEDRMPSHSPKANQLPNSSIGREDDRVLQPMTDNLGPSGESQSEALRIEPSKGPAHFENAVFITRQWPPKSTEAQQLDPIPSIDPSLTPKHINGEAKSLLSVASNPRSLLLQNRAGSRTSTLGSARTSSLSTERAAAAKARLAQRRNGNRQEIS